MNLRYLRFAAMMFTAVTMSAAFAHLMEMPAKLRYEKSQYVTLHRTLYWNFGRVAGIAEILALLTTAGIVWVVRTRKPKALPLTAAAAGCLAAAHTAFWIFVSPANSTMGSWTMDAIPDDWTCWRDQWEYTHAIRAGLVTGGLGLLTASVLQETGSGTNAR